jgi:TfoX/Sxy family transcriptional regulator of competence genes
MFSGAGLFCDGLMFGLVVRGVIYLKVDETSIPDFKREGSPIPAAKAPAASAVMRCRIGGCRNGSTTIPTSWRSRQSARLRSRSTRNSRRRRESNGRGRQGEQGRNSNSTERWNDRGAMDEVSSHVHLDLPFDPLPLSGRADELFE